MTYRSTERRFGLERPIMGLAKLVNDANILNADTASRAAVEETTAPVSLGGIDRSPFQWWRSGGREEKEAAE